MLGSFSRSLSLACGLTALAIPAQASDWYVDAIGGSDAASGTSPAAAWRTLTHALSALAQASPEPHALHVAPGVYSTAHGESFPLSVPARVRLIGSVGAELHGPASGLLDFVSTATEPLDAWSGAERLRLLEADRGIAIGSWAGIGRPEFRELVIEDMGGPGVYVTGSPSSAGGIGSEPLFERIVISGCGEGLSVHAPGGYLDACHAWATVRDSVIQSSRGHGARVTSTGSSKSFLSLQRCLVRANSGDGLSNGSLSTINSPRNLDVEACLITGNGGCGILGQIGIGAPGGGSMRVRDCTIVGNALAGLRSLGQHSAQIENSILASNAVDVDCQFPPSLVVTSLAADGTLAPYPGGLSGDPGFEDAAAGDYSLRWGSPCIDRATSPAIPRTDLSGASRTCDGDLDASGAPDLGALEFTTLRAAGLNAPGGALELEVWGPSGSLARMLLARTPLAPVRPTPFGEFRLLRPVTLGWLRIPLHPAPGVLQRAIPQDPRLVGRILSIQGLVEAPAAPRGLALTNAVEWLVGP